MLKSEVIQVSGRGTNVDFHIDESAPFEDIAQGLREYLVENRGLWSGGTITITVGDRLLSQEQLEELKGIVSGESGLQVARVFGSGEGMDSPTADALPAVAADDPRPAANPQAMPGLVSAPAPGPTEGKPPSSRRRGGGASRQEQASNAGDSRWGPSLLVKNTCRSGEIIRHSGDVVIMGDVNPGAEIIAEGDIAVFGQLRGFAHAGSKGNMRATIVALNLDSPRIQIGPHAGTSSQAGQRPRGAGTGPMIAFVRRKSIHLAPFSGGTAKYTREGPYDG